MEEKGEPVAQNEGDQTAFSLEDPVFLLTLVIVFLGAIYWYWKSKESKSNSFTANPVITLNKNNPVSPKTTKAKPTKGKKEVQEGFLPLTLFFGSQTGTAEEFSKKLAAEGKRYKFDSQIIDLEDFDPEDLKDEKFVMFSVATYGEGEPTDNARNFMEWLEDDSRPEGCLKGVKFTVFGLGNKTYEHYNEIARKVDKRLEELGAERVFKRGEGDDDSSLEDDFASWKKDMWPAVCAHFGVSADASGEEETVERRFKIMWYEPGTAKSNTKFLSKRPGTTDTTYDAKNPYIARILANKELHSINSDRSCRHIEIETNKELNYEVGDHLGVYPDNDAALADAVARRLGVNPDAYFSLLPIAKESKMQGIGPCTVRQALMQWVDLTTPPRKSVLKALVQYTSDPKEKTRLQVLSDDTKLQPYAKLIKDDQRTILEVLLDQPSINIPFDVFLETMPRMQPRYYSISSSMKEHPGQVHITLVVVNFTTPTGRKHAGVCSNYLAKLVPNGGEYPTVPVFIHKSTFRTPKAPSTPIIMVGPGTGLAPFRGFLHDRKPHHNQGKATTNVLFFGCRHPDHDYIYQNELEDMQKEGHVDLSVAFSRHMDKKVYVQHKIEEEEEKIWELLHQKNAHFYICGDARAMAKDVHGAVRKIIMKKGNRTEAQAEEYLTNLQKTGRYQTDVWF